MSENLKYKILTFIRYLGDSFFYPFFAMYLKNRGLIENEIGFILSISPLVGILINPLYSHICKNFNITKNVLTIISIIEAIFIILITISNNFILISILTICMAIFGSTHYGLFDSLISIHSKVSHINYSSIRIFGSMAYIIGTTMGGVIIQHTSYFVCFSICFVLFILSGIFYGSINKHDDILYNDEIEVNKKEIIKNKSLWFFILTYVFIMGPLVCSDSFFSVYLESRGLNSFDYGLIYSYYVIIEVILLFIFNKYSHKINNNYLIFIAAVCVFIRAIINGSYLPLYIVSLSAGLRGISYACLLHVSFKKIIDIIGSKNATFGIMLLTLLQSIFVTIFNNINGEIISMNSSYEFYYYLMGCISIVGIIFASKYVFFNKKRVKE